MELRGPRPLAWRLSPAYDVAYAYNPSGPWTRQHQMSLNGKRDDFDLEDLVAFGGYCGFSRRRALALVEEVSAPVSAWRAYADDAGVYEADAVRIQRALRLELKAARPA